MGTEFIGLGKINDPLIASRVSWTDQEQDLFYHLLATRKNDPKYIARAMKKSYLEIQARCSYLDSLAKQVGPVDRSEIPLAFEVPDDLDDLEAASPVPELPKRILRSREDTLFYCDASSYAINESGCKRKRLEICDQYGTTCSKEVFSEILDHTRLFLIDIVTGICNEITAVKAGKNHVLNYLEKHMPFMLGNNAYEEIHILQPEENPEPDVAGLKETGAQEPTQESIPDYETDSAAELSELNEEQVLDEADLSRSRQYLEGLTGNEHTVPSKIYVSKAELDFFKGKFQSKAARSQENKICYACGIKGGRSYVQGRPGLDILCVNCNNWKIAKEKRDQKELSAEEVFEARFKLHRASRLKSCDICSKFDENEYRKGATPFENICRLCSLWITHHSPITVQEIYHHFHNRPIDPKIKSKVFCLKPD